MLGEKLGEFQGKVTGQRIRPAEGANPKTETSFEISGTLLGIDATMMGTYWTTVRSDGLLYGRVPDAGDPLNPGWGHWDVDRRWSGQVYGAGLCGELPGCGLLSNGPPTTCPARASRRAV
jgi:hypothetical protein